MRISIRIKMFLYISLLIIIFICISILFNLFFLKFFYIQRNKKKLYNHARNIEENFNNNMDSIENQLLILDRIYNLHSSILKNNQIIFDSNQSFQLPHHPEKKKKRDRGPDRGPNPHDKIDKRHEREGHHLFELIKRYNNTLSQNKHVFDISINPEMNGNMLHILYPMQDYILIINRPLISIKESSDTANRFYIITIPFLLLIGGILTFIFSSNFTKPILKLSTIAQKMSKLDFQTKYEGKANDEIGKLGQSINSLSKQLNHYINSMKKTNKKLLKEVEKEREIEKMRKEFINNVSHELKTPIAIIQGYAEGLNDNIADTPEKKNEYCNIIIDEAGKMDKLVKELLEISQYESGLYKLNIEKFDITDLTNKVLLKYSHVISSKKININMTIDKKIVVKADKSKIEQVLTNYISNAVDHVNKNGKINISIQNINEQIRFSIINTGSSIPEGDRAKIWDSFYKGDKARNRSFGGTGLGLAIVKSIMKLHKTDFGVNNVKEGVEFWFELVIS